MTAHRRRAGRRGRGRAAVGLVCAAVLVVALAACGGDDGDDGGPGDEESFCRLAKSATPVADADAETLLRLEELAPDEIRTQVGVLRDLAERVAEIGQDDPEALALEFEVRFSDEFIEARHDVEAYQRAECAEAATTTSRTKDEDTATTVDDGTTTSTADDDGDESGTTSSTMTNEGTDG